MCETPNMYLINLNGSNQTRHKHGGRTNAQNQVVQSRDPLEFHWLSVGHEDFEGENGDKVGHPGILNDLGDRALKTKL